MKSKTGGLDFKGHGFAVFHIVEILVYVFDFFMCADRFDQLAHGWLRAGFRTSKSFLTHPFKVAVLHNSRV